MKTFLKDMARGLYRVGILVSIFTVLLILILGIVWVFKEHTTPAMVVVILFLTYGIGRENW